MDGPLTALAAASWPRRLDGASFSGCPCPYCHRGRLEAELAGGFIVCACPLCGGQVMSEREWANRQRYGQGRLVSGGKPSPGVADAEHRPPRQTRERGQ